MENSLMEVNSTSFLIPVEADGRIELDKIYNKNQVCNGWNHEEQLLILLFVLKYLNDLEQVIPFWISFSLLHIKWPDHFKCQVSLLTFPDSRFPLQQYQQWENWSTMFFSKLLERIPGVFGTSHASNYLSAGMRGAAFSHWLTLIMSVPFSTRMTALMGNSSHCQHARGCEEGRVDE